MQKWYDFKPNAPANKQNLPPEKKYVLVRVKNCNKGFPDPVCVGYLKYHAGIKTEPRFITPGCTINTPQDNALLGDGRVLQWCDCLLDDFEWYEGD